MRMSSFCHPQSRTAIAWLKTVLSLRYGNRQKWLLAAPARPGPLFQHVMWPCHCAYNFHASQWPTVIIVMYGQKTQHLGCWPFLQSHTGQPSPPHTTTAPCLPPALFGGASPLIPASRRWLDERGSPHSTGSMNVNVGTWGGGLHVTGSKFTWSVMHSAFCTLLFILAKLCSSYATVISVTDLLSSAWAAVSGQIAS